MKTKKLKLYMDLDSTKTVCPCGEVFHSSENTDEDFYRFVVDHHKHTNGQWLNIVTEDGARCLNKKPMPYTEDINIERYKELAAS